MHRRDIQVGGKTCNCNGLLNEAIKHQSLATNVGIAWAENSWNLFEPGVATFSSTVNLFKLKFILFLNRHIMAIQLLPYNVISTNATIKQIFTIFAVLRRIT